MPLLYPFSDWCGQQCLHVFHRTHLRARKHGVLKFFRWAIAVSVYVMGNVRWGYVNF